MIYSEEDVGNAYHTIMAAFVFPKSFFDFFGAGRCTDDIWVETMIAASEFLNAK